MCLSKLISFSGNVIKPYLDYPNLLDTLLAEIQLETDPNIRIEYIRIMGYLGAVDPNLSNAQSIIKNQADLINSLPGIDIPVDNYYPSVVFNALFKILKDSSVSMHHEAAIQCFMYVISNLNTKFAAFLPQVIEPFITYTLSVHDKYIRVQMIQNLCSVVSISNAAIQPYTERILSLVFELWYDNIPGCIRLTEELAMVVKDSFAPHVSKILPFVLEILEAGETNAHLAIKALIIFNEFDFNTDSYGCLSSNQRDFHDLQYFRIFRKDHPFIV
jgi:FKBP12-rapamycin complex-associated protein